MIHSEQTRIEEVINLFLKELCSRDDLLVSPRSKDFFALKGYNFTSMLPPKYIQKFYSSIIEEEIFVAGIDIDYEGSICLLWLNSKGAVSNFGRIWNILQKTYLGAFDIYYIKKKDSLLPEFKKIYSRQTEEKVTDGKYVKLENHHKFYLSMHSGKLLVYKFCSKFKEVEVLLLEINK